MQFYQLDRFVTSGSSNRHLDQPDVTKHSGNASHYASTDLVVGHFEVKVLF